MIDGVIAGTGNSRNLKSVSNFLTLYPTYSDFVAALVAGTLPIDLNGINAEGWTTLATALNRANLLSGTTAPKYFASPTGAETIDQVLNLLSDATFYNSSTTYAFPSTTFTAATLPSSANWRSVAYGDGKFVAIASDGTAAAYSSDGITWYAATLPSSAIWHSVTYGDGKFVAVASDGTAAAYSSDGITWYSATLPSSTYWYSVAYGDSKFVAVASGGTAAAYSTNGITWYAATLPSSANWQSVAYGNGKFVAIADSGTAAAYSSDGITWYAATLPSSANWYSVAYGDSKFVAVAYGSTAAAYSSDGITWYAATLPSSAIWHSVTYGDGKFVAVASDGTAAAYSSDGITWYSATLPSSTYWYSVAYGDSKFVAVASGGTAAAYLPLVVAGTASLLTNLLGTTTFSGIATGSYTGSGLYGSSHPNSLTFPSPPKLILMGYAYGRFFTHINGMSVGPSFWPTAYTQNYGLFSDGSSSYSYGKISADGKEVSWYNTSSAASQCNASSLIYQYVAIG